MARVWQAPSHQEWDAFLASVSAHYAQTSAWSSLKADAGWRASRVAVVEGSDIVAGAQLLFRPLPAALGTVGYVPKGPVLAADNADHASAVMDALLDDAKRHRMRWLGVQPPTAGGAVELELADRLFHVNPGIGTPATTLRLDLGKSSDELLADMSKWTRRNIRRGESRGITTRLGGEDDIATFVRLRQEASRRKQFYTRSEDYYGEMWRIFRAAGQMELFLAEYEEEVVSGMLTITFGNTAYAHASAWSGKHGTHKPNEVLEWAAICWAQAAGYKYFDLEGIVATETDTTATQTQPAESASADPYVTAYKMGFGGQIVAVPQAYEHLPNPLLRWGYRQLYPRVERSAIVAKIRRRIY